MQTEQHEAMRAEINSMRRGLTDVKNTLAKVVDVLERMARLEERHANTASGLERAFTLIAKLDASVSQIERHQPMHKLAAGWVVNGAWAAVGVVVAYVLKKLGVM
jgi:multidrug resistance efflux pump